MIASLPTRTQLRVDAITRIVLTLTAATCLWFGYEINSENHLGVTHLATVALFGSAIAVALYRRRTVIRGFWGTRRDRLLAILLLIYISVRLLQSAGNPFYFGQALKIGLVALGFVAYKVLDPEGRCLRYCAVMMPALLAVIIAVGLVIWVASGDVFSVRFRVGPNDYEYVSEYACHMLPLLLFAFEYSKSPARRILLAGLGGIILIGLTMTGSRAAMAGTLIVIVSYAFLARKRLGWRLAGAVAAGILLVVLGVVGANIGRRQVDIEPSSAVLEDDQLMNQLLSGRWTHWLFQWEQLTSSTQAMVFGTGLGKEAEWTESEDTGGFYRTAIVNAILAAWTPFGLIGMMGYLFLYRYLWKRAWLAEDGPFRAMTVSLLLAFIFTDQFETHWQGTRMLWYVSFIFYVLTLARPRLPLPTSKPAGMRTARTLPKSPLSQTS